MKKSKKNTAVLCPHRPQCPGCPLIELPYEEQLAVKQNSLLEHLKDFQSHIQPFEGAKEVAEYRNRAKLAVRPRGKFGLYLQNSHRLIAIPHCPIHMNQINSICSKVLKEASKRKLTIYDEIQHRGFLRYLIVRQSRIQSATLLILVTRTKKFPEGKRFARALRRKIPKLSGVIQNVNSTKGNVIEGSENIVLDGKGFLLDKINQVRFIVSATSFLQGNHKMAGKIYQFLSNWKCWERSDLVFDLYSGIGLTSLHLAAKVSQIVGIEHNPICVADSRKNKEMNKHSNLSFFHGSVEERYPIVRKRAGNPNGFIVNPPRKGCSEKTLKSILKSNAKKLAYLSCSPKTLARDLHFLVKGGFEVEQIKGFDLYPQTEQIETVTFLSR